VEIPGYQPFYLATPDDLRAEIARLGLAIPVDDNVASLAQPLSIGSKRVPNRFCAQPISGCDADALGAPGDLTRRRYGRYAAGGFGLIWFESTVAGAFGQPAQLCLHQETLDAFRSLVQTTREAASVDPVLILQLTSAPFTDAPSDDEIERRRDEFIEAAALAPQAGFDGVDLQCCHGSLAATSLRGFSRTGRFGGSFEGRSRFILETLAGIRERTPELLLATRLSAYDATRDGFGVSPSDYRKWDPEEPARLVQFLQRAGLELLNVTAASPNLRGPAAQRALTPRSDSENPDEHPLMTLDRQLRLAQTLRAAAPGMVVVGSGFSWLRQWTPQVAAGALRAGMLDLAGLGRGALANPAAPAEIIARGRMEPEATCMVCFACSLLQSEREPVGCVIRDSAIYGPLYRRMRRFDADQLMAGARRCHLCENAPCVAASPTRTDIPAFIQAFLSRDENAAYEIIRERDALPELTSQLSPSWLQSEGACIETTLTGTPVPILDLQYTIAWRARDRGLTGARIPPHATGRRVAIVGGGPAGIAAAVRLVELGHTAALFERSMQLGGTPAQVIPASRLPDLQPEIEALLRPAIAAERLRIHTGATLGENLTLEHLRVNHDAVLIATGLWQEQSLGRAEGVIDALSFLASAKAGQGSRAPDRVALLAGGDSAMDAARVLQSSGAQEIFVLFGGPRSALHWHMRESWWATPGVHAMMSWQATGYEVDATGRVCGVRIRHTELQQECLLAVGLVVEAMGLEPADALRAELARVLISHDAAEGGLGSTGVPPVPAGVPPGGPRGAGAHAAANATRRVDDSAGRRAEQAGRLCYPSSFNPRTNLDRIYAAGALVNGGASVSQCVAEGLAAAAAIHDDLTG
jgi:2,4-dienoyl-CoA reductase (NADPH2)